ncbi:YciI family protein [Streptosporangium sp. NPDC000396]|uniref:YciI family protein n=1 Tax=Streptosporangium sp. NPDC000396 TaxID=3366185 RepID=UPI0036ADCCCD
MFILLLHYRDGALDQLDQLIPEHYEYVDKYVEDGVFLLTGRRVPRTGGVILATGVSRERIEEIVTEDPFLRSGAVTYEIVEFEPTRSALEKL